MRSLVSGLALALVVSACGGAEGVEVPPTLATAPVPAATDDGGQPAPAPSATPEAGVDSGVAPPPPNLGSPVAGVATYYAADGSGSCSFDKSPQDLLVAALNLPDYAGSAACGACIEVDGPTGSVTVRVVDSCPGCAKGHVDLSSQAFAKISPLSAGRVNVTWKMVPCAVQGPISYKLKEGSSKFYTAIQVRNHRIPVAKLEYKKAGAWVDVARRNYNYFVADKGVGDQPTGLVVRVTASTGATLEDTLPGTIVAGALLPGKAQFP